MSEAGLASRVTVSSIGMTADDQVDEHFGRARYFIIADEQGDITVLDNTENRNALQGAGIAAAELVASAGVSAVITGHLGPKAFAALSAAGLRGYEGTGLSVGEALKRFAAEGLRELSEASEAHAG